MSAAIPIALGLGVAALVYGSRRVVRFIGDKAQPGDEVLVATSSIPPGSLPAAIPEGAGSLVVQVDDPGTKNDVDFVYGPIVAILTRSAAGVPLGRIQFPAPVGPITVSRSTINGVTRDGRQVT